MKLINKYILGMSSALLMFASCSDFEELNINKTLIEDDAVSAGSLLNKSIYEAQQNPHIQERIFVLTWKRAARYERGSGFTIGTDNDGWNTDYFGVEYGIGWLNSVNNAINLINRRITAGTVTDVEMNLLQMSRIWRAYLVSELADCFGPIPVECAYDGTIAPYKSVKDLYSFMLEELKDASSKLDKDVDMSGEKSSDLFYGADVTKWQKYANSLRLRLAMRLNKVNPDLSREHVAEVSKLPLITDVADIAKVAEKDGWSPASGVMSRTWNPQPMSSTMNNILLGLGGLDTEEQLPEKFPVEDAKFKNPMEYMGVKYDKNLTTQTNDPSAGFFFDALPSKIDPRALVMFNIPGYYDTNEPEGTYPSSFGKLKEDDTSLKENERKVWIHFMKNAKEKDSIEIKLKYTWNTWVAGKWDKMGDNSTQLINTSVNYPSLANKYRNSTNYRIWFGNWETYFLLAEAALDGWVTGSAKDYYKKGVEASFVYHGVEKYYDNYITSRDYNRVGTSVDFDHTDEAADITNVKYIDGYTGAEKTMTYKFPKNSIYNNGATNNDQLTKIITQKYIANFPYLPLEAWNDHRRLGLPFFENQAAEVDYTPSSHEVPITKANCTECKWEFYPKRLRYPANMEVNSKDGYDQAIKLLGGVNDTNVPLYWCMPKP